MEKVTLRNHISIPMIGLGTWKITDRAELKEVVSNACDLGYRLFDTAAAYTNEMAFGKAIRELSLPREELFIQDKLWNTCYGYEQAQDACKRSLKKLKTDYLDAYLIHWPASPGQYPDWREINAETWRGMEQLYKEGYVRVIGVCNFKIHHLEELKKTAEIFPFINQAECHPGMYDAELDMYCQREGIQLEASSPLGNGQVLDNGKLREIAQSRKMTVAQLCLKWGLQHGNVVIPKTTHKTRLRENFLIKDVKLDKDEMKSIDEMPFCGGLAIDSDEVNSFEGL